MQYSKPFRIFAVPNGGKRGKIEAANLKKEGVTSGVSDLIAVIPGQTLYIELKTPETEFINPKTMRVNKKAGGKQSEAQKEFQEDVEACGHKYYLIDNLDDFIKKVHSEVDKATKGGHNNN